MIKKRIFAIGMFLLLAIMLVSSVSAYVRSTPQFTQLGNPGGFGFDRSSLEFDKSMCEAGQDFVIQIAPFGCEPAVVRSDLLEEQNVPVFCQLAATKINPLIDVEAIEGLSFKGDYPSEVAGVGFQPAKAALGVKGDLNSPVLENIGYAVIVLRKQENASKMSDYVVGNLSVNIKYDIKNALGIGRTSFYLPTMTDSEWDENRLQYGFWDGRGYLRAEEVGVDAARIALYDDTNKLRSVLLEKGKTSEKITLPGFDCLATLQLKLDGLVNPDTRVKLRVGGDVVEVGVKEKFLEDKCYVTDIVKFGVGEKTTISCREDEGSGILGLGNKALTLVSAPKLSFKFEGKEKEVTVGELLFDYVDGAEKRGVYLAYAGSVKGAKDMKAVLISLPYSSTQGGTLSDNDLVYAHNLVKAYTWNSEGKQNLLSALKNSAHSIRGVVTNLFASVVQGEKTEFLSLGEIFPGGKNFGNRDIVFVGFASPIDEEFDGEKFAEISNNYEKAKEDYETIINNFGKEKIENTEKTYGEEALYKYIFLANELKQKKTVAELCEKFKQDYPKSKENLIMCNDLELSNAEASSSVVYVNGRVRDISLLGIYEPTKEEYSADILIRGSNGKVETINLQKDEVKYLDSFRFKKDETIDLGKDIDAKSVALAGYSFGTSVLLKGNLYVRYHSAPNEKDSEWQWNYESVTGAKSSWRRITVDDTNKFRETLRVPASGLTDNQVKFLFNLKDQDFIEGVLIITKYLGSESIELVDLEDDKAKVRVSVSKGTMSNIKDLLISDNEILELDKARVFGAYSFALTKVNLEKSARVSVIPGIENQGSNTTFQFKVGIEKRSIELSPEKTKNIINNLNETLAEWEENSEKLGNLVKTMKGACLGVGAALTVKNFFANLGGKAIARQNVMRGEGGWTEICKQKVASKVYDSVSACYDDNADDIEKAVDVAAKVITEQNKAIKEYQKNTYVDGGVFGNKVIDTNKYMDNAVPKVNEELTEETKYYYDKDGNKVDMTGYLKTDAYKEQRTFTQNELREIDYNSRIMNSDASERMKTAANKSLQSVYGKVFDASQAYKTQADAKKRLGSSQVDLFSSRKLKDIRYTSDLTFGQTNVNGNLPADTKVRMLTDQASNKDYLVVINNKGVVQSTHEVVGGNLINYNGTGKQAKENPLDLTFTKIDSSTYNNPWKGIPEVRYFETEPYKGFPETVPVDVKKGWYASIRQTVPVGGQISAYDNSGRVASFYLCNIGVNQLEENRQGDDACTLINTGTRQPYNQIAGLKETEASGLINNAIKAIEEASKQHKSGLSGQIKILGQIVKVGAPAANVPALQCEDMMSPKDCKILFNVCDPVVCPSSRCDLGGTFAVKDVVQSGIIGSLVLCLPNFPQVVIPVCLTGIKAGMDGWLSILTSYRDCMQESLETGQMTGVCDEIYSIHACQFFWRQTIPLAKLGLPKLMSAIAGQGTRGGGEYLGVQNAWNTAQSSLTYFTQYYAANSFKAFKARSAEQVGDEVCNTFISGVYPSGDFLDTLTEPDSPSQFHGRFDEIPFTTATNPPTSQYKVFYHIYAGNDRGGYYRVYLKGDPGSSYYQDTSASRTVAQGYVKKGEYASETIDFTATSGYAELCINVNGQEECGFKQVSTSFAVDYVNDQYIKEQTTQTNIKSESECISGSASVYSLLSPNMEGAADEALNPAVYKRGIIRICASKNPGASTDVNAGTNESRWREVGYCGDVNIKCWIDTDSVKDIVKGTDTEGQILSDLNANSFKVLEASGKLLDGESFSDEVKKIGLERDLVKRLAIINDAMNRVFYNHQRARLLLLRAEAYGLLAGVSYGTKVREDHDVSSVILNYFSLDKNPKTPIKDFYATAIVLGVTIKDIETFGGKKIYVLSDGVKVEILNSYDVPRISGKVDSGLGSNDEKYLFVHDPEIVFIYGEKMVKPVEEVESYELYIENLAKKEQRSLEDSKIISELLTLEYIIKTSEVLNIVHGNPDLDLPSLRKEIESRDISKKTSISLIEKLAKTTAEKSSRTEEESKIIADLLIREYSISTGDAVNIVHGNPDLDLPSLRKEIESRKISRNY